MRSGKLNRSPEATNQTQNLSVRYSLTLTSLLRLPVSGQKGTTLSTIILLLIPGCFRKIFELGELEACESAFCEYAYEYIYIHVYTMAAVRLEILHKEHVSFKTLSLARSSDYLSARVRVNKWIALELFLPKCKDLLTYIGVWDACAWTSNGLIDTRCVWKLIVWGSYYYFGNERGTKMIKAVWLFA